MADRAAWGSVGEKYDIHAETFSYFLRAKDISSKSYEDMTPEEMRAVSLRKSEVFAGHADFTGSDREFIVPCPDSQGGVPVTVYRPSDVGDGAAVWIYFHGGGMVTGSRNTHATLVKTLAMRAGCIAVSVEYRLAPEHKTPAAVDDCLAATHWVLDNRQLIGGHPDSRVGVGGDSAGGHLAAVVSQQVPGVAFQILVYPHTDLGLTVPSVTEFTGTPGFNTEAMRWFMDMYLADPGQKTDPRLSPRHGPLSGLPPALCVLAELDPLRDDGQEYCRLLGDAGVEAEVMLVKGAPHVFFHLPGHFKELTKEPYARCVDFIRRFHRMQ